MAIKTYTFSELGRHEIQYINFKAENVTNSKYFNGNPNISLRLPLELAEELVADGWKVNIWNPSEESIRRALENGREQPQPCGFMDIAVDWPWSNSGTYPIVIKLIEDGETIDISEDTAKCLDDILPRLHFADITIRGRAVKNVDGSTKHFIPCLKQLYVYADADIMEKRRLAYLQRFCNTNNKNSEPPFTEGDGLLFEL